MPAASITFYTRNGATASEHDRSLFAHNESIPCESTKATSYCSAVYYFFAYVTQPISCDGEAMPREQMCLERTTEGWVGVDGTDGGGETVPYVGAGH